MKHPLKTTEGLMIENLLQDKDGDIVKIVAIYENAISIVADNYISKYYLSDEVLYPIELSPEILGKIEGFEETSKTIYRQIFDHDCNYIGYNFNLNGEYPKGMHGFRYYGQIIKCEYLHELQILFFALTGNQLKISI